MVWDWHVKYLTHWFRLSLSCDLNYDFICEPYYRIHGLKGKSSRNPTGNLPEIRPVRISVEPCSTKVFRIDSIRDCLRTHIWQLFRLFNYTININIFIESILNSIIKVQTIFQKLTIFQNFSLHSFFKNFIKSVFSFLKSVSNRFKPVFTE